MKRALVALCSVFAMFLGALVTLAGTAAAASKPVSHGDATRSTECLDMAKEAQLRQWFCVGGNVYDIRTGEQKSDNPVVRQRQSAQASIAADDYDFWCEDQAICDRQISTYIMETKANYEWGVTDSNGIYTRMGLFDAVIRVNLEGRTARDKQTLIWDYGPALYYPRVWVNCFRGARLGAGSRVR